MTRSVLAALAAALVTAVPGAGAAATPGVVILECWWFRPRDLAHVQADLRRLGSTPTVEVWCDVPAALARERYPCRTHGAAARPPTKR